jgi:hypothetical protein
MAVDFDPSRAVAVEDDFNPERATPVEDSGFDPSRAVAVDEPSWGHKLITNLWYAGDEAKRQQPNETPEQYNQRLLADPSGFQGERPPFAESIAKGIDTATGAVSKAITGKDQVGGILETLTPQATRVPNENEISFMHAGIPRPFDQQQGTLPQIGAAIGNAPVDLANFALSPGGGASGVFQVLDSAPWLVKKAVEAGFTLQQAWAFYQAGTLQEN